MRLRQFACGRLLVPLLVLAAISFQARGQEDTQADMRFLTVPYLDMANKRASDRPTDGSLEFGYKMIW